MLDTGASWFFLQMAQMVPAEGCWSGPGTPELILDGSGFSSVGFLLVVVDKATFDLPPARGGSVQRQGSSAEPSWAPWSSLILAGHNLVRALSRSTCLGPWGCRLLQVKLSS